MLSKKNRVGTKTVEQIFKHGRSVHSSGLSFKFTVGQKSGPISISFIAPKSVAKLAVDRNKLRRRGYTALRKNLDHFPAGISGVLVFKKYQDNISEIENEIKTILNKIN